MRPCSSKRAVISLAFAAATHPGCMLFAVSEPVGNLECYNPFVSF